MGVRSSRAAGDVSFGDFEVHLRTREIYRKGERVRIPDQSFRVLAMLLERPGELVPREEVRRQLWPEDTFVDFDHGLNNVVNRLREALGDSAGAPRYIETLPRRGYRFVGTISGVRFEKETTPDDGLAANQRQNSATIQDPIDSWRLVYPWLLLALVPIAAIGLLVAVKFQSTSFPSATRTFVLPPDGSTFNLIGDEGGSVALSRDGRRIAFVALNSKGENQVWVRPLDKLTSAAIADTEGATFPFWSPDGRWIGFFAHGKLRKVRSDGSSSAVILCDSSFGRGGSWNSNGIIIFAPASHSGIYRVSDGGGVPTQITAVDSSIHTTHRWPKFLPDGVHFIYLAASHFNPPTHDGIYLASLDGTGSKFVVDTDADAAYASGYLFFLHKSALIAQRFDFISGQLRGELRATPEKVLYDPTIWKAVFDVSDGAVMAYQLGDRVRGNQFRWFDHTGRDLGILGEPSFQWEPSISGDGRKLVVGIGDGGYSNLWMYDLASGTRKQITFSKYDKGLPIWSSDSNHILFSAKRLHYSLYQIGSTGAEPESMILDTGSDAWPLDLSHDGKFLLYGEGFNIGRAQSRIWVYPMNGASSKYRLLEDDGLESDAQFSPDGRWVAYTTNESGRDEVYVMPFVDPSSSSRVRDTAWRERRQISTAGGHAPRWRRNGTELFYLASDNTVTTVPILTRGAKFVSGSARPLFHVDPGFYRLSYDVLPDGSRFVINTAPKERTAPITVVENWQSDFK